MVYDHSVKFRGVWYAPGVEVPEAPVKVPEAPVGEPETAQEPQKQPRGRGKGGNKVEPESIELEV